MGCQLNLGYMIEVQASQDGTPGMAYYAHLLSKCSQRQGACSPVRTIPTHMPCQEAGSCPIYLGQ